MTSVKTDFFHFTDETIVIPMPALKRPTLEKVRKNSILGNLIKRIERDDSPEHAVIFRLAAVVMSTELSINGEIYERMIAKFRVEGMLLGFQHREWLMVNQDNEEAIPDSKVRAALKSLLGKTFIDFPGIIFEDNRGGRHVQYFARGGVQVSDCRWLSNIFDTRGRIAVASK